MSGNVGHYLFEWYPELQHVVELMKWCLTNPGTSHQLALKPFWSLHAAAIFATSYIVIRFV